MCPCRSALSTPAYPFPTEFVAYEAKRTAALAKGAGTKWLGMAGGKLAYGKAADGSQIPDFSAVGYHAGERALPAAASLKTLATLAADANAGDDTARIQAALDAARTAALDANGYRGAVVLGAGVFRLATGVVIKHDGVVLRGAGAGATTLLATAKKQVRTLLLLLLLPLPQLLLLTPRKYTMVEVLGASVPGVSNAASMTAGRVTADAPIGAKTLKVADASGFKKGDVVMLAVPLVDAKLVEALRMDKICFPGDTTKDPKVGWTWTRAADWDGQWSVGYAKCNACTQAATAASATLAMRGSVTFERTVLQVDAAAKELLFKEPICMKISASFGEDDAVVACVTAHVAACDAAPCADVSLAGGAWVFPTAYGVAGSMPFASRNAGARIKHAGVEDLELKSAYVAGKEDSDEAHAWRGVRIDNAENCFARRLACKHIGASSTPRCCPAALLPLPHR